ITSVQAQSQPEVYKHSAKWPRLLILRALTNTVGAPFLRVFCEARVPRTHTQRGLCRTDKSCVGSIATRPCKKRKDSAPSVGMVHAKIGKGGHPPVGIRRLALAVARRCAHLTARAIAPSLST